MSTLETLTLSLLGTKVPGDESSRERRFQGTKVPGDESSRERKFHLWNFRSRERKFSGTKVPVTIFRELKIHVKLSHQFAIYRENVQYNRV